MVIPRIVISDHSSLFVWAPNIKGVAIQNKIIQMIEVFFKLNGDVDFSSFPSTGKRNFSINAKLLKFASNTPGTF